MDAEMDRIPDEISIVPDTGTGIATFQFQL